MLYSSYSTPTNQPTNMSSQGSSSPFYASSNSSFKSSKPHSITSMTTNSRTTSGPSTPSINGNPGSDTPFNTSTTQRKHTCFAFYHMPDVDPETKYYNPKTKALE